MVIPDDQPAPGSGDGQGDYFGLPRAATETRDFQVPVRHRAGTEPVDLQPSSATRLRRSSTLTKRARRKRNTTGENTNPREPYSFTFDNLDDSSSSSGDDERRPARLRARTAYTEDLSARTRREEARRGHSYSRFHISGDKLETKGRISRKDGRLNISVNERANGYVAKAVGQRIEHHLNLQRRHTHSPHSHSGAITRSRTNEEREAESFAAALRKTRPRPRLNIVIMVIGSRGDIQPFIKVGKILKQDYGHRVRIASHPMFRGFVNEAGLEFFSVGGDPAELMAFMVKNPGLIPNLETIREGEIQRRRNAMAVMFDGFWRSCLSPTDDEERASADLTGDSVPFVADAIIANPPSMAHVHIAERLGIPLHMMFTFPYSPTQQFPHPLANVMRTKSNVDANYMNFLSYPLVELMTWSALGDVVNHFRVHTLQLEPVSSLWAPGALYRMHVPYTYLWSPALCPKPADWGPEIDVAGFAFLDLASNFKPDQDLKDFLDAGDPPVYIGFGSIVLDDPDGFTRLLFEAIRMVGCRVLLNKGWGGFGVTNDDTPDNIFMLGNTPHDWLFPRVKAVVHHGGAGTTAIGLKCAKPTLIVPWFGDQPFWGAMVAEARAGAHECIPYKKLTAEKMAEGIRQCLTEEAQMNVQKIADSMAEEGDGAENAVVSFHRSLPLSGRTSLRCSVFEDRPAVWQVRHSSMRLSALAADILHRHGKIAWSQLKLRRHMEWNDLGPGEPFSGGIEAVKDSFLEIGDGAGMIPIRVARHIRTHEEHERRRKERRRRKEERAKAKATRAELKRQQTNEDWPGLRREGTNLTTNSFQSSVASISIKKRVLNEFEAGIEKAGWALLTLPNNFHVAVSRGLHNAPRLYGDATVRTPIRITGFKSGTKAAGQEFVYGLYDGATGVFTQPVWGWREGSSTPYKFARAGTGVAKGVTGFFLKTMNAAVAPPAFFCKGIFKYVEKRSAGPGDKAVIRRARIVQGQRDYAELAAQKSQNGKQQLTSIEAQVLDSWSVMEDIWELAAVRFGSLSSWRGRLRFSREQKRWQAAGALESVDSARLALNAYREGRDVEQLFSKRGEELDEDEQRQRVGVMEEPQHAEEDKSKALADGKDLGGTFAREKKLDETSGLPHDAQQKPSQEEDSRAATLTGTPRSV